MHQVLVITENYGIERFNRMNRQNEYFIDIIKIEIFTFYFHLIVNDID